MRLKAYLREDLVLSGLSASDADGVLRTVAEHLAARGVTASAEEVEAALRAREGAHTTCMGHGMALPHATDLLRPRGEMQAQAGARASAGWMGQLTPALDAAAAVLGGAAVTAALVLVAWAVGL